MKRILCSRLRRRRWVAIILLGVVTLSGLTGCNNRAEGLKLAEAGLSTADTLAQYYDSLAQDTLDIWEWEAFNSAIRGVAFDDREQQLLQNQIDALNRRSRLARRLGSTYSALKELTSYDASGEVKTSVENLASAITSLPPLKGGANPGGIFGTLAQDLIDWKQSRDLRKGGDLILKTLEKLKALFASESEAYKSIPEERANKIENIIDYSVRNKIVLALPLLQKVPDAVGLKLAGADKPVDKEETILGLVAIARVRAHRVGLLSAGTADATEQALEALIVNHQEFREQKGLSLSSVLAGIERAQAYLDEIGKLRKEQAK